MITLSDNCFVGGQRSNTREETILSSLKASFGDHYSHSLTVRKQAIQ